MKGLAIFVVVELLLVAVLSWRLAAFATPFLIYLSVNTKPRSAQRPKQKTVRRPSRRARRMRMPKL